MQPPGHRSFLILLQELRLGGVSVKIRDTVILAFALSVAGIEIIFGEARASVLTFCAGLIFSPAALHLDERRRSEAKTDNQGQ